MAEIASMPSLIAFGHSRIPGATGEAKFSGSKRTPVVEGDAEIRDIIAKRVLRADLVADAAEDCEDGRRSMGSTDDEMVIADRELPRLTVLDAPIQLRADSSEAPCILMAASHPGPKTKLIRIGNPGAVVAGGLKPDESEEIAFSLSQRGASQRTQGGPSRGCER